MQNGALDTDLVSARGQQSSSDADSVAVSVDGVSKTFRIGASAPKTLKERLLAGLSPTKPTFTALDDISFNVYQGETFGILGHNGSGKSTLLKIVAGIMAPTSGRFAVQGRLAALLELGAGFHPELTGAENIFLNGAILGLSRNYVEDSFRDIVDFAEIEDFIHSPVKHYSSGMRARLGFSVATHLEPDVLLVDEVLAVGDERFRRKCMERVYRFRSTGRTMILVTHSTSLVSQLCKRSAVLSHGRLIFVGESHEAIAVYRASLSSDAAARARNQDDVETGPTPVVAVAGRFDHDDAEPVLNPRDSITFTVDLEAFERRPFRVRVNIRTEEGLVLVNQATSRLLGHPLELDPGLCTLSFRLNEIPLRDGRYAIDVMVESPDGKEVFHRLAEAGGFTIVSDNRHLGVVALDMTCHLHAPIGHHADGVLAKDPS